MTGSSCTSSPSTSPPFGVHAPFVYSRTSAVLPESCGAIMPVETSTATFSIVQAPSLKIRNFTLQNPPLGSLHSHSAQVRLSSTLP